MIFGNFEALVNACLLGGIVFFFCGWLMKKHKPVWPKTYYGYRTPRSLQTKETFDAGNEYSAELMKRYGAAMSIVGILFALLTPPEFFNYTSLLSVLLVLLFTVLLISKTESYLKERFG